MKRFSLLAVLLFAALPATTNYKLNSYGFGSGGTANSHTTTYSLEGETGDLTGSSATNGTHNDNPGYIQTQQANVPKLSALDNNGGQYYNKLHFVIDQQGNPTDAKYLLAVTSTTDPACTTLCYVQTDGTLSTTLSTTDYQTYSLWGGSSGSLIIGLLPSTTYTVKVRATQGKFTESPYGPSTAQATAAPTLTFSLVTSTQSTPPYSVSLGTLQAGTVNTTSSTINAGFTTNGASGGNVYVKGQYGGLKSSSTGYLISTVSNNLTSIGEGFGAQNSSVNQTSGGPFTVVSPYNGTANTVGSITPTASSLYTSTVPVTGGSGTLVLKAKSGSNDIAANDYQEILTFLAAANF